MATFYGHAKVLRDDRWIEIPSRNLAVGDILEVEANETPLSVDCVILSGDVVVDESSLTGEALPVTKFALKQDSSNFSKDSNKINCLYAGTYVLETQHKKAGEKVIALVLSTGGSTEKGKLVRDILYPVPFSFVFNEHLKIVFPILILWGVLMLILSIMMLQTADIGSWFYGMFGISQVLSPILPAVLVIGQSVSSERLRSKGILCVDLNRITLAGKVKVFCFDKTGTLTKEGIEFMGAHEVNHQLKKFGEVCNDFSYFSSVMQLAMQTCHSISLVQGRIVGNFVDVEMFKASNGSISKNSNLLINSHLSSQPVCILKRFEFNHAHAYMSVVVQDTVTEKSTVFVKGSFEKVAALVNPLSIPQDYLKVAKQHASLGFYVLAIACRMIETSPSQVDNLSRDELESNLELVGLMLFRNELKPETALALKELREGGCRNVMITGDNANTAIFVAKACDMILKDPSGESPLVLMAEYIDENIRWHDVDTMDAWTLVNVEKAIYSSRQGGVRVELVITGKAFGYLAEFYWINQFLGEIRVFARMSPLDKVQCVRLHMANHITAMCGDGGNDAGALKAAHAGIALSGSGSSVVSHFSSSNLSIMSCVELIKEARCSLDVSLASYKILIMYGEILAFSSLIQYYFMVQMSQSLWIFIDGCTVPLSWALSCALPAQKLSKTRPTARLLGKF
jgi:predicted P-type ATPase